jgi:hypothetical protein
MDIEKEMPKTIPRVQTGKNRRFQGDGIAVEEESCKVQFQ